MHFETGLKACLWAV